MKRSVDNPLVSDDALRKFLTDRKVRRLIGWGVIDPETVTQARSQWRQAEALDVQAAALSGQLDADTANPDVDSADLLRRASRLDEIRHERNRLADAAITALESVQRKVSAAGGPTRKPKGTAKARRAKRKQERKRRRRK